MQSKLISAVNTTEHDGPYAYGVIVDGILFTSGYIGIDDQTGQLAGGVVEQTHQILKSLDDLAKSLGSALNKAIKVTIFLKDLNDFKTVNEIYQTYFNEPFPARSCVEVDSLLMGAAIQIEAIISMEK